MTKNVKELKPADFYDSVVISIAELTQYTLGAEVHFRTVIDKVLEDRGLDIMAQGKSRRKDEKPYLQLRIEHAFRNQRDGYRTDPQKVFCCQGSKRGMWSLTTLGLKKAADMQGKEIQAIEDKSEPNPKTEPERPKTRKEKFLSSLRKKILENLDQALEQAWEKMEELAKEDNQTSLTSQWMEENFTEVYESLKAALFKKFSLSADMDLVEDHAMYTIEKILTKELLEDTLKEGEEPNLAYLASWACRDGITQFRKWGQDLHARNMRGARTGKEMRDMKEQNKTVSVQNNYIGAQGVYEQSKDGSYHLVDPKGVDPRGDYAEREAFEKAIQKMESLIREDVQSSNIDHYIAVLHGLVEGDGPSQVAREYGFNRSTASNMKHRIMGVLAKAQEAGEFDEYLSVTA